MRYRSWHEARRTCDKFLPNSMLGPLEDVQDWEHFFDYQKKSNAMSKECEAGGRYLHWLGYRYTKMITKLLTNSVVTILFVVRSSEFEAPKYPSDFLYLGNTKPLSFNFFRPKQPNAKNGDQCLVSYLSLEPNVSVYDFACETKNWQWASCTACFLSNTFHDYSNIVTRGLCSRTKFDTLFEVKRISRLLVHLMTFRL